MTAPTPVTTNTAAVAPAPLMDAHLLGRAGANLCGVIADLDIFAAANPSSFVAALAREYALLLEGTREDLEVLVQHVQAPDGDGDEGKL